MDKAVKKAIKQLRETQKQRAALLKRVAGLEQNMTKVGWDLAVLRAQDDDEATRIASEAVNSAIRCLHEAMNALGRVESHALETAKPVRPVAVARVEPASADSGK